MGTINLEKELIKQNKKLLIPSELLVVKEYDKYTDLVENDALSRVGLNNNLQKGKRIKERLSKNKLETINFNQERVFHISQIKGICEKYRLRFLKVRYFKGVIDEQLPVKIQNFEIAYGVSCDTSNTMIVAPMESFELEEKPKDPLFFYEINDEYYYLIHKWGNDLSLYRSILPLFESVWASFLIGLVVFTSLGLLSYREDISGGIIGLVAWIFSWGIWMLICMVEYDGARGFIKKNEWDSKYK